MKELLRTNQKERYFPCRTLLTYFPNSSMAINVIKFTQSIQQKNQTVDVTKDVKGKPIIGIYLVEKEITNRVITNKNEVFSLIAKLY